MQLTVKVQEDGSWRFDNHKVEPPAISKMCECFGTVLVKFLWNGRELDTEDIDAEKPTA